MHFAQYHGDGHRNPAGIIAVVGLHVILIYALANGLGHKVVEAIKKPLEVTIVEEVKIEPPSPPPPPQARQTPPTAKPLPAYAPPPEVPVTAAPVETVVTTATPAPPPAAVAAPAPPAVEEPARPRVVAVGMVCPGYKDVMARVPYPPQAARQGLSGDVLVEFTVMADGSIADVGVNKSSNKVFNAAATAAVAQFHCVGQGQSVKASVPFVFRQEG